MKHIENQIAVMLPYFKEDFANFVKNSITDGMHEHLEFMDTQEFIEACIEIYEEIKLNELDAPKEEDVKDFVLRNGIKPRTQEKRPCCGTPVDSEPGCPDCDGRPEIYK